LPADFVNGVKVTMSTDWAGHVVATSVNDASWEPLLESLHAGVKEQLQQLSVGKRFSELTEGEQAALVERSFHEVQQSEKGSELVTRFSHRLGKAVNDELLRFLLDMLDNNKKAGGGDSGGPAVQLSEHASNADQMLELFAKAVMTMLEGSPPEMASTLRLFINRPLPDCLRGSVWVACLTKKLNTTVGKSGGGAGGKREYGASKAGTELGGMLRVTGKLAPSLDVLFARRCHALLDVSFYDLSSRSNASFVKVVTSNFMRMIGLKLPSTPSESFAEVDQISYLVVPLVCVFRLSASNRRHITEGISLSRGAAAGGGGTGGVKTHSDLDLIEDGTSPDSRNVMERPNAIETALYSLLEPRQLGLLSAEDGKFFLVDKAPPLGRALSLLHHKDIKLLRVLETLRGSEGGPTAGASGAAAGAVAGAEGGAAAESGSKFSPHGGTGGGGGDKGSEAPSSSSPAASSATNFDAFVNQQLKRGLSGLVNLRTCLFVWDQGFVVGFGAFLPLVVAALVLGASDELKSLTTLKAVYETLTSFCQSVSVETLQRLLSEKCGDEMRELFDGAGSYKLDYGENKALQAVHKEVLLGGGEEE
jgi:hypothetical protein